MSNARNSSPKVVVVGASGFAGALTANLLYHHPYFELTAITARSDNDIGRRLDDLCPHYRVPLQLEELDIIRHSDVDAAVVAYPHTVAAPAVAALRSREVRVVDLSADFRFESLVTYEEWYAGHPFPQLLPEAVYGLTELHRQEIREADLVAGPGCFPTGALLALAPLARVGLIADLVIDAKTGISGTGRTPSEINHFSKVGDNVVPYATAKHRHRPEIEEQLGQLQADLPPVQFQPHLVPVDQGELLTCYVTPTRAVHQDELTQLFRDAYKKEPFVELAAQAPTVHDVQGTNICRIYVTIDLHTGKILVFATLDNLWKGAASQAVQNLNEMFKMNATCGLSPKLVTLGR